MSAGLLCVRLALGFLSALAIQPEPPSPPGTPAAGQAAIVPQLFLSHRPCLQVASRDQPEGFRGHHTDQRGKGRAVQPQHGPSRLCDITQDWVLSSLPQGYTVEGQSRAPTCRWACRPPPDAGTEPERGWLPVRGGGWDKVSNMCTVPFPKGARLLCVPVFQT